MKIKVFASRNRPVRISALFLLIGPIMAAGVLTAQTNTPSKDLTIPKSVFDDKLKTAKDPFFPNSTRGNSKAAPTIVEPEKPQQDEKIPLVLSGIVGRFALINGQTFAPGESGVLKSLNRQQKITVIEIKPTSVIIVREGKTEREELRLKE